MGVLALAALVSHVLSNRGYQDIAFNDPLVRAPEFLFGMALAMRVQSGWRPRIPMPVALAVMCGACFIARKVGSFPFEDYVIVLPTGLLLVAGAVADIERRSGILTTRPSVYLGEVSFAFYLVHTIVLAAVLRGAGWGRRFLMIRRRG